MEEDPGLGGGNATFPQDSEGEEGPAPQDTAAIMQSLQPLMLSITGDADSYDLPAAGPDEPTVEGSVRGAAASAAPAAAVGADRPSEGAAPPPPRTRRAPRPRKHRCRQSPRWLLGTPACSLVRSGACARVRVRVEARLRGCVRARSCGCTGAGASLVRAHTRVGDDCALWSRARFGRTAVDLENSHPNSHVGYAFQVAAKAFGREVSTGGGNGECCGVDGGDGHSFFADLPSEYCTDASVGMDHEFF